MNIITFLVILCIYVSPLRGSVIVKSCPDYKPVNNFNIKAFGGTWYEAARYPNEYETTNCTEFNYTFKGDKLFTKLVGSTITADSPGYFESSFGVAPGAGDKGILLHEASHGKSRNTATEYIVALDYENYYISAVCLYDKDTNTVHDYAWVTTRSKDYGPKVKEAIDSYLTSSKVIDKSKFVWLDLHDESC